MPRGPSARTGVLWRERLERFSRSGLSAAQFCAREGVSTSSLYNWRRKLEFRTARRRKLQGSPAVGGAEPCDGAFQPVTVVPSLPGVAIQLPGGARIEIGPGQLDTIRAVVAEVLRIDRSAEVARTDRSADMARVDRSAELGRVDRGAEADRLASRRTRYTRQEGGVGSC